MKTLLVVMMGVVLTVSGCAGLQRAREAAANTEAAMGEAITALEASGEKLKASKAEYDAAVASGDSTKLEAATKAMASAVMDYETHLATVDKAKGAFEAARAELESASSTSDYLWGILGMLGGAAGIFFGGKLKKPASKTA